MNRCSEFESNRAKIADERPGEVKQVRFQIWFEATGRTQIAAGVRGDWAEPRITLTSTPLTSTPVCAISIAPAPRRGLRWKEDAFKDRARCREGPDAAATRRYVRLLGGAILPAASGKPRENCRYLRQKPLRSGSEA